MKFLFGALASNKTSLQPKMALELLIYGSFTSSYRNLWPRIYENEKVGFRFQLLIVDEYLKFLSRDHYAKDRGPVSFLFSDPESYRPDWLPTQEEQNIIEQLRDDRHFLIIKIRDEVRVASYKKKGRPESPPATYYVDNDMTKKFIVDIKPTPMTFHFRDFGLARDLMNDPFFPIPFKFLFQDMIAFMGSGLSPKEIAHLKDIELKDTGTELLRINHYDRYDPDNRSKNQFQKDLVFTYFFVCLEIIKQDPLRLKSAPSYDRDLLKMTCELYNKFHHKAPIPGEPPPGPLERDTLHNFIKEFDRKTDRR